MGGAVVAGVGEDEAGAALERGVSGTHGVATGGDVVHEIDLAVAERGESGFKVVLFGRGRGQVAAVAGALGFDWPSAADGLGDLRVRARCRAMWAARIVLARVEPSLAGIGTSQQGVSMSAAISQAAVSKSRAGLRGSLMA